MPERPGPIPDTGDQLYPASVREAWAEGVCWYYYEKDGSAVIYDFARHGAQLRVPAMLDGLPVTGIAAPIGTSNQICRAHWQPAQIRELCLPEGLRFLGEQAFLGCSALEAVHMPDSLESIGMYAFADCLRLKLDRLPKALKTLKWYAFQNCEQLTEIAIPDSVRAFHLDTFAGCRQLRRIILPKSMETFEREPVTRVIQSLEELRLSPGNERYAAVDGVLFDRCMEHLILYPPGKRDRTYTVPPSVRRIAYAAFTSNASLEEITLPAALTAIGGDAFWSCTALRALEIPDSVEAIGSGAFSLCTALETVKLPPKVQGEGEWFTQCRALKRVTLPECAGCELYGCRSLECIGLFPSAGMSRTTVDGVLMDREQTRLLRYPPHRPGSRYRVPETVTEIAAGAFSDCTFLEEIILPPKLQWIPFRCFQRAQSLRAIDFPSEVRGIAADAFEECTALEELHIPPHITQIGRGAFCGCRSLKKVTLPWELTACSRAFEGCSALTDVYLIGEGRRWCNRKLLRDNFPKGVRRHYIAPSEA